MSEAEQVVFCDLDGTLVLDNSFHVFLAAAWSVAGAGGRLALGLRLALRALGGLAGGHAGMKRRSLSWFWRQDEALREAILARTVQRLQPTLSAPVVALLRDMAQRGARIVLATAAPDLYARRIQAAIGAEDCLATPGRPSAGWAELLGQAKAQRCQRWLAEHPPGAARREITVVTDHPDDLPLLDLADRAVLQGSARAVSQLVEDMQARPGFHCTQIVRLDVLSAQSPGGGYWLWFDDRPEGPLDDWEVRTILSKHRHARLYAGEGRWRPIGPGQPLEPAVRRRDCPRPPSSRQRLAIHLRRRLLRDWLGLFH